MSNHILFMSVLSVHRIPRKLTPICLDQKSEYISGLKSVLEALVSNGGSWIFILSWIPIIPSFQLLYACLYICLSNHSYLNIFLPNICNGILHVYFSQLIAF